MPLKWSQCLFIIVFLIGIVTITLSLNVSRWLPSYDPNTFTENFSDPILNLNLWRFVGEYPNTDAPKGTYSIQNSEITLNAPPGGVSFLRHSYVTFWPSGVNSGAWMGSIEFSVRLNNLSDKKASLKLARIDGGWAGVVNSQLIYYDEVGGTGYSLQNSIDSNWHSFKIHFGYSGREVYWDGRFVASIPNVQTFTYLILGHADSERSVGGSASFAWVKSNVEHR